MRLLLVSDKKAISYMPTDGLTYDPSENLYWDEQALGEEVGLAFLHTLAERGRVEIGLIDVSEVVCGAHPSRVSAETLHTPKPEEEPCTPP